MHGRMNERTQGQTDLLVEIMIYTCIQDNVFSKTFPKTKRSTVPLLLSIYPGLFCHTQFLNPTTLLYAMHIAQWYSVLHICMRKTYSFISLRPACFFVVLAETDKVTLLLTKNHKLNFLDAVSPSCFLAKKEGLKSRQNLL